MRFLMNFRVLRAVVLPLLTLAVGTASLTPQVKAEDVPQTQPPTEQPPATPITEEPPTGTPAPNNPDGRPDMPPPGRGRPRGDEPMGKNAPEGRFKGRPDGYMGQEGVPVGGQRPGFGAQFPPREGGYRNAEAAANLRRVQLEGRLRALMGAMGFPDVALQTTIIKHIEDEEKAMTPVRGASRALMDAMRAPTTTPERLTTLLNDLHVALEADKLRRKEAQLILDNKVGFSRAPRLQAMLTLLGVLDDSPASLAVRNPTLDLNNRSVKPNLTLRVAPPLPTTTPAGDEAPAKDATPAEAPKVEPAKAPEQDATPQDAKPTIPTDPDPPHNK